MKTSFRREGVTPEIRKFDERGDGVLLLHERRNCGYDEAIEVLVASPVAVHQPEQVFDIAGADVDHDVVDGLQVLLQLPELSSTQCLALALVGIEALDGDEFCALDAGQQQVTGDGALADVAGEVEDCDLHRCSFERMRGLVIWPRMKTSATSLPLRRPGTFWAASGPAGATEAVGSCDCDGGGMLGAEGWAVGLTRCGSDARFASRQTVLMVTCTPAFASAMRIASRVYP